MESNKKFLDYDGLKRLVSNIKNIITTTVNESSAKIRSEITKEDLENALDFEILSPSEIKQDILDNLNGMEDLF